MTSLFIPSPSIKIFPPFHKPSQTLAFCNFIPISNPKPHQHYRFRLFYKFPKSLFPVGQVSDADDEEEEEDDEDDDEDIVADEYEDVLDGGEQDDEYEIESPLEISDVNARPDDLKWKRVEKFCNEVREFGEGLIDVDELAAIYNFPIDKFQRLAIQAFLRGSSTVVSAPTSSGKTLIAEAAAVATVAKGRRLFYTTPNLSLLTFLSFRRCRYDVTELRVMLLFLPPALSKLLIRFMTMIHGTIF